MKWFRFFLIIGLITTITSWAVPLGATQSEDQIIHTVLSGENLYRISLRYGVAMDAIMTANGLTNAHTVYAGQQLIIPLGPTNVTGTETPAATENHVYMVQLGDTLSSVALYHGVTIWTLVQANDLANPHIIYAGQQLIIPAAAIVMPIQETPAPTPPPSDEVEATYTVRAGDTLYRIAQQHGTTANALAYLNGITNPSTIHVGQVIQLVGEAPAAGVGGKRIVVDLSEQHLYAYQGDLLLYSFTASSGAAPSYTRAGEFHVQSKIPNAYGATWNIWMPHWLGIYWAGGSENGIHALPILSNGQTLWAGYLGTPISYGCIVLGTYEAKLLYDWAEMGTPVTIQP